MISSPERFTAQEVHIRQALLLAARQEVAVSLLWELVDRMHAFYLALGLARTWAFTLQQLVEMRPELASSYPQVQNLLAAAWTAAGDWERARRVLVASHGPAESFYLARHLYHRAALLWCQGHWQAAHRLGRRAWSLLPNEGSELLCVQVAHLLLLAAWRLGRSREALLWGQRALERCSADNVGWQGRLHHRLFLVLYPSQPHRAEQHLHLARERLESAQNRINLAHLWADATDLYLLQGRREAAEASLHRAYRLWQELEDPAGMADYYRHAARVARALGRLRDALEYADHALERWTALGHRWEMRRCRRQSVRRAREPPDR